MCRYLMGTSSKSGVYMLIDCSITMESQVGWRDAGGSSLLFFQTNPGHMNFHIHKSTVYIIYTSIIYIYILYYIQLNFHIAELCPFQNQRC